jgi:hypothetical protein
MRGVALYLHVRIRQFQEARMDDQATGTNSGNPSPSAKKIRHEDRNTWILTAYAISGLAFFGVLFFYIAQYAAN